MPTISYFYGIAIRMFDHPPPHIHAIYGEYETRFLISTGDPMDAQFSKRASRLVMEWVGLHRQELTRQWHEAENGLVPTQIDGLDADKDH